MTICKACRPRTELNNDMIARALETLCQEGAHTLVSSATSEMRLRQCEVCPHLEGHLTCRICGCFAPIRARIAEFGCPHPAGDRWAGCNTDNPGSADVSSATLRSR